MIVIIGGSGFIGTALSNKLKEMKMPHKILDINPKNKGEIKVDISNKLTFQNEINKGDTVIHLAALINAHESDANQKKYYKVNILGTQNVVDVCEKKGCNKIIFPSSAAVYNPLEKGRVTEKTNTNPINYYGITKVKGEKIVLSSKINKVVLRFSNAYGKGGKGIVNQFIKNIKEKKPLTIWGSGNQERDFIHVNDIVDSLLLSMTFGEGLYNISTSKNISINGLANLVCKVSNTQVEIKHLPLEEKEIHYIISNELAKKDLGFSPKISLEEGIRGLI